MANIKNMRMWDTIRKDNRIEIISSFLGLRTRAYYKPTQSPIEARVIEYSPTDGERLLRILACKGDERIKALTGFTAQPTVNGNYMLELSRSRDGSYAALMLLQYRQMVYEPITDVIFLEGIDAEAVASL